MSIERFMLSSKFINTILNNEFGTPDSMYFNSDIYVGLGIEFDSVNFIFTKEPVSRFFTVTKEPVPFSEPVNGIIRNASGIEWPKAEEDWTGANEKIERIGIFDTLDYEDSETKELIKPLVVLRLATPGSVLRGESVMFAANSIELSLTDY